MTSNSSTQRPPRVGWVVDVQNDFMRPDGRLYVHDLFNAGDPGAIQVTDAIVRSVAWMREHCDVVVFTGDWHGYGDREIDTVAPDATRGTYPPHCMGRSPDENEREGAEVIAEVRPGEDVLTLPSDASDEMARETARRAVHEHRPVFIQKTEFSVFEGNRSADIFVRTLVSELGGSVEFVVCGVATDVCVRHAVEGMLDRELRVRVIPDAIWSLGLLPPDRTLDAWEGRGATRTPSTQLPTL